MGPLLHRLTDVCARHAVLALYLFGSRAQEGLELLAGRLLERGGSDLDVGVVFAGPFPDHRRLVTLQVALEDAFSPLRVDLKIVGDRLQIVAVCVAQLRALPVGSLEDFKSDFRNAAAADSLLRRAIEALFDAARHLLARAYGLGALEYREVARLASEKGLVADPRLGERNGRDCRLPEPPDALLRRGVELAKAE